MTAEEMLATGSVPSARVTPPVVDSKILVTVPGGAVYVISPGDELTKGLERVMYADVMRILSAPDEYLDLWIDTMNELGERTRVGIRLFSKNVVNLIQVFVWPASEHLAQS